jgi:hypothetical protein
MPEPRDPRAIIEEAEHAATAGNYASAETLLREAALVQEATLGPFHPDLANTLNNLGIVCEITSKPTDAEQFFRRAVAIATTCLHPDHPFVATSRKNLRDFCDARGKPGELPTSKPAATREDAERDSTRLFTRVALGALGPLAMLMVILAAGLPRLNSQGQPVPPLPIAVDSSRDIPAPPVAPAAEPIPPLDEAETATEETADDVSVSPVTAAPTQVPPQVLKARLCADLDEWRCDPPDDPVPPGPLFFYTQVKTTRATTVQHRWYRDDRLNQSVELPVQANSSGFRTFSRSTMNGDSAGRWRVELRTGDGVLLHEARFTVH